jgi:hypothetical protein
VANEKEENIFWFRNLERIYTESLPLEAHIHTNGRKIM